MRWLLLLALWIPAAACAQAVAPLSAPGRVTFADLGWDADAVVRKGEPATVRFWLPEDARQGDPFWYGVTLRFEWDGSPRDPGDYAFLWGNWNGKAVYQFKVKRVTDIYDGFQWSMADIVNGGSVGHERGESMRVASSNFAQLSAVQGGWNKLRLSLGLRDANNDDISVAVSRDSQIIATSWEPTRVEAEAKAWVRDGTVDVSVRGRNAGWGADNLRATVLVWSGRREDRFSWDIGPLEPLGSFDASRTFALSSESRPHRVDVALDWGTGRTAIIAWDARRTAPDWLRFQILRSTIAMMGAVVVLWVTVPTVVSALKERRRERPRKGGPDG